MSIGPIFRAMKKNKAAVGLLILEIALTLTIIISSLNLIKSARARILKPSGVELENILALTIKSPGEKYAEETYLNQVTEKDLRFIRSQPGVVSASPIHYWPLKGGGSLTHLKLMDAPDDQRMRSVIFYCGTQIIQTLGLDLIEGRAFLESDLPPLIPDETEETATDRPTRSTNIIVTLKVAEALFPKGDALGKTLLAGNNTCTIIGIVRKMYSRYGSEDSLGEKITFYPFRPASPSFTGILVKTEGEMFDAHFTTLEEKLQISYPNRIISTESLAELKAKGLFGDRIFIKMLSIVMVLLLFVTILGIYGMTSFSVAKRKNQIGVRRALGARKRDIISYFLSETGLIVLMGSSCGVILALIMNGVFMAALDSMPPLTVSIIVLSVAALFLLSLLSTLPPSLKATRIPPIVASKSI
ncbi:ABC transporter permease [candidate division CSSED10-310 bacterium]|uniref:ABC transporter permease n=1 Tax=candidate division CSSED10-310 bacterium TaxID=2855610 RepID=A0ABV6YZF5_UNCC1